MKTLALRTAFLLGALTAAGSAFADDKIIIMVGGIEKQIYLPARLTEELGYFKEQGLDVELQSEPAGVNAENQMLAGAVQGVVGFYDHTIDLQAKGKAAISVVQFSQAPGEVELVSAKLANVIKSPADFKGRSLGVTGLGSSTNFLTQYLAAAHGVKPSEITPVPVGAGNTFIAAMKQGRIDAGMTTEPTISHLLKEGEAKILVDLRTPEGTQKALGGLYPAACLYMPTAWVNTHRTQVQKLANAFVKTLKFINTHSAADVAAKMPADFYAGDKAGYIAALAGSKTMFTADGRMPVSGPPTVLKVLQAFDKEVQGKTIDLTKTYTAEFVSAVR
ncbi:ABC transporter substrate-binding protein [Chitinimonas sp.]|uniref:ABC transporter substrate-binding protein n=1 Tax=Chitinimonas sp. TaxID=1934313 RepID=UPI002F95D9EB